VVRVATSRVDSPRPPTSCSAPLRRAVPQRVRGHEIRHFCCFCGSVRGRCAGCGAAPPRSRAPGGVAAARALRAPLDLRASAAPSGRACGQAGGLPVGVRSAPEPQPGGWPPVKIVE